MKRWSGRIAATLILWMTFLCAVEVTQASQKSASKATNDEPTADQEVTDEEATACGIELARKFTEDPAGFCVSCMRKEDLLREIGSRLTRGQISTAMGRQLIQMINRPFFFRGVQKGAYSILKRELEGSQCVFLGLKKGPRGTKIVLRNLVRNGVQYYSFICHRQEDGTVVGREAEALHAGGSTVGGIVNIMQTKASVSDDDNLNKMAQKIGNIGEWSQQGEYQKIVEYMRSPERQGKNYEMDRIYLAALSHLTSGDDSLKDDGSLNQEYAKAVETFRKNWPDSPVVFLELISLDIYFIRGEDEKFLQAIQTVREDVCNDPYLTLLIAYYYMEKSPEKALEYALQAKSEGLQIEELWEMIVVLQLEQGADAKEMAPLLQEAGELFGKEVEQNLRTFVEQQTSGSSSKSRRQRQRIEEALIYTA